ncbi:uncharacterized protein LOC124356128 [Homalodisca vitripennis]|uniref:uncharacterized protein LOC124356128 n=1 Tax=Homalodisca vitripennis TaxID=197043 RepID=UPI001EEC69CA|nr:uncharacterized protein LOC124356128 [Homalodisca vitripennis]
MTVLPDPDDANDDTVECESQSVVTHPFIYNPPTILIDGNIEIAKFSSEDDFYSCFYCESQWKAGYKALEHMEEAHGNNHTMYDLLRAKMETPCQGIAGPSRTNKTIKKSIPSTSTGQEVELKILVNSDPDYVYNDEFREDLTKNSNVNQVALVENKTLENKLTLKYRKDFHSVSSTFFTDKKKKKKRTSIPEVLCKKCKKHIHPGDMRIHKKYHCGNETEKREWILKKGGKSMCLKCRKMVITRTVDFHVKYMCRVKPFSVQCFYCTKFCTDYRRWIAHIKMAHNKTHYFQDLLTILPEPEQVTDESSQNGDSQREVEHPFIYNPPSSHSESNSDFLKFSSDDDFFFCFYCGCKWTAGYKVLDHMEDVHNKLHNMYDLLEAKIRASMENQDPEMDTVVAEEEQVNSRIQTKIKQEINENNDYGVSSNVKRDKIETSKNKIPVKVPKKKVNLGSEIFNVQKKKRKRLSVVKITCLKCSEAIHPDHVRIHKKYHCGREPAKKEWILYSGKALCLKCNKLLITNSIDFHCRYLCQMKTFSVQCFYCTKVFSEYRSLLAHMQKYHNKSHYVHDFMTFLPEPESLTENPSAAQRIITHPFIYPPPVTVNNEEEDQSGGNTRFPSNEDFYSCFYCSCEWKAGYKLIDHMEEVHEKKHNLYDLLRAKMTASSGNFGIGNIDKSGKTCFDVRDLSQTMNSVLNSASEEIIKINEDKQIGPEVKDKEILNKVINIESDNEIIFDFPESLNTSKMVSEGSSDHIYHMNADKQNTKDHTKSKLSTDISTPNIKERAHSAHYAVGEIPTAKNIDISSCQATEDEFSERNSVTQQTTPIVITVDCTKNNDRDIEIIDIDMDETCQDKFRRFGGTANTSLDKRNEVEIIDLDKSDEDVLCDVSSVTGDKTLCQDDVIMAVAKDFYEDVESSNHKETFSKDNGVEIEALDVNRDPSIKIKNVFTVEHSLHRYEEAQFEVNQSNDGSLNLNEEVEITFYNVKKDCQRVASNSPNQLNINYFKENHEQQNKSIVLSSDCMDQVDITCNYMDMEPSLEITNVTTLHEDAIMCGETNLVVSNTENNELVSQDMDYNNDSSIHDEDNITTEYEKHADSQIPTLECVQSSSVQNEVIKTSEQNIVENCQVLSTDALVSKSLSLIKEDNITEQNMDESCQALTTSPVIVHNSSVSEGDNITEQNMDESCQALTTSPVIVHNSSVSEGDNITEQNMDESCQALTTSPVIVHNSSVSEGDNTNEHDKDESLQIPSTITVHSLSVNNYDKTADNSIDESLQIPSTITVHSPSVNNDNKLADNSIDESLQIPSTITVHIPSVNNDDKTAENSVDESLQIPSASSMKVHSQSVHEKGKTAEYGLNRISSSTIVHNSSVQFEESRTTENMIEACQVSNENVISMNSSLVGEKEGETNEQKIIEEYQCTSTNVTATNLQSVPNKENKPVEQEICESFTAEGEDRNI